MPDLYVMFSHTNTGMGRMIRAVTGSSYNHVSISLRPDLAVCYSFARRNKHNALAGGFVAEDAGRLCDEGDIRVRVCRVPVTRGLHLRGVCEPLPWPARHSGAVAAAPAGTVCHLRGQLSGIHPRRSAAAGRIFPALEHRGCGAPQRRPLWRPEPAAGVQDVWQNLTVASAAKNALQPGFGSGIIKTFERFAARKGH